MKTPKIKFPYLKRKLDFEVGYDKRDPDPSKNCGVHGMNMRFMISGKIGVVQFLIYTNWMLPHVRKEQDKFEKISRFLAEPMAADIGYHSRIPQYEGQKFTRRVKIIPKPRKNIIIDGEETSIPDFELDEAFEPTPCSFLQNDPCFYDGSSSNAEAYLDELVTYGEEALYEKMIGYYTQALGNEEHWLRNFYIFQEVRLDSPESWFYLYRHYNGFWERSANFPTKYTAIKAKLKTHCKVYYRKSLNFIKAKLYNFPMQTPKKDGFLLSTISRLKSKIYGNARTTTRG